MKKISKKQKRKFRVRKKVFGTAERPRLSIYRSNKGIYAQIIDDEKGETILGASSRKVEKKVTKIEKALELGRLLGADALKKKIKNVVFDRGASKYHGRVKAVADGARESGLEF